MIAKKNLLIFFLAIVCIVVVIFHFTLKHYLSKFNDAAFLSSFLSEKIGYPVSVKKVSLTKTGKLLVEELRIDTPKDIYKQGNILYVKKTLVSFNMWEVLIKHNIQSINRITFIEPHLTLTNEYINWFKTKLKAPGMAKKVELPETLIKSGSILLITNGFGVPLEKIEGQISSSKDAFKLDFNGIIGKLGVPWKTAATLTRYGEKKIKININDLDIASICKFVNISVPAKGKFLFQADGSGVAQIIWTAIAKSDKAVIRNIEISNIQSYMSYKKGIIYISDLSGLLLNGKFTSKGTVLFPVDKNFPAFLKGNFNNLSLGVLSKIFPELSGISGDLQGSFNLLKKNINLKVSSQISSSNLVVKGNYLPYVNASIRLAKEQIIFNPLTLSDKYTSVQSTGSLFYKQKRIKMTGYLNGQSIRQLSALFKISSQGLNGNLYGGFVIEGDVNNPTLTYNGRITHIVYNGAIPGTGRLNISVHQEALKGRMELNEPVKISSKIIKGGAALLLSFDISGTVKKPIVTPITKNTKFKIDVPKVNITAPKILNTFKGIIPRIKF